MALMEDINIPKDRDGHPTYIYRPVLDAVNLDGSAEAKQYPATPDNKNRQLRIASMDDPIYYTYNKTATVSGTYLPANNIEILYLPAGSFISIYGASCNITEVQ